MIGNSNYVNFHPSLPNPRNDAEDVSAALRTAGFEVFLGLDLTKKGMEELMQRFARAANGADAALTYYAGHGLQYQGRNYLVPVDARIEDEIDIEYQTTPVNDLVVGLSRAKGARIIILDACRNLPLEEKANRSVSVDTGLARISGSGLVVAYATQANALAYDGTGRNSLFTGAFLQALNEPGSTCRNSSSGERHGLPEQRPAPDARTVELLSGLVLLQSERDGGAGPMRGSARAQISRITRISSARTRRTISWMRPMDGSRGLRPSAIANSRSCRRPATPSCLPAMTATSAMPGMPRRKSGRFRRTSRTWRAPFPPRC